VASTGLSYYFYSTQPRLAYVRSDDLIEKYSGTIDVRSAFEKKKGVMIANVDSLKSSFEQNRANYLQNMANLPMTLRKSREEALLRQQDQITQYSNAVQAQIEQEDVRGMEGVLNQINSFIEKYSIENGYDIMLGTTLSGSLLYGNKGMDVTDDILLKINAEYKGKK
jgi:outer membrane protein